jgi:hypothetical protein
MRLGELNVNEITDLNFQHQQQQQQKIMIRSYRARLPPNIDILRIQNLTESKNFTCHAQNTFGLVVFNMSIVIKGIKKI